MTLHRKSGCPDSLCHHLARRDTQNTTLFTNYSASSSASCSDWQVRAPVGCQLGMASHLGIFQCFETASQDAPLFLPQCRCYIELLPHRLLTLLDVGDLKQMNAFYSHVTLRVQTHTRLHAHLFQSLVCVGQQSLTESLRCLDAPPLSLLTHRLAE